MSKNLLLQRLRQNHSLAVLSALWLGLCASLVWKHRELIYVFFSFVGSFAIAGMLAMLQTRQKMDPGIRANNNSRAKNLVSLVACTVAFYRLSGSSSSSPGAMEYSALSIMAGYLAFDHWFSFYCQPPSKPLLAVIEDALSLTFVLCVLSLVDREALRTYRSSLGAWLVYKTLRLALRLDGTASVDPFCRKPQQKAQVTSAPLPLPPPSVQRTTSLSDKVMAKVKATSHSSCSTEDVQYTWIIHGQEYNLQAYVEHHPGGKEAILLGRGRDCTALFESYHPFTTQHKRVLQKYRVEKSIPEISLPRDAFYEILCERVERALRDQGLDPRTDRGATRVRRLYYTIILAAVVITGITHVRGSFLGSWLFALFGWLVGALGHDAGHFAVVASAHSNLLWINDAAVWAMSLLCNPILWQHQHTYAHHSHTNDFERDPDLHHFETLLRVHQRFQQRSNYRYQSNSLFVAFAYTFVVFGTCFWIPWGMLQEGSLYGRVEWTDRKRLWRTLGFYVHLLSYVAIVMVAPFWTHTSWLKALGAVTLHVATTGLLFAVFSQINHLNERSLQHEPAELQKRAAARDSRLTNSWAVSQVETSNNFAPNSTHWHVLSNGLNYQIEHHLFPGLNHCHLHRIAPVVRSTCHEFGVSYKSYETWSDVMQATLDWLDQLSIDDKTTTTRR